MVMVMQRVRNAMAMACLGRGILSLALGWLALGGLSPVGAQTSLGQRPIKKIGRAHV